MLKLEDLQVDTHVAGIEPSAPVKLLYVKRAGAEAADVTYELFDGRVLKKTLFRADEARLSVASETRTWAFDAKPESFSAQYGTEVTISMDVAARSRGGFDAKTVRVVKENANTLKLKIADFEVE